MKAISAVLFFLSQHPGWSFPILAGIFLLIALLRKNGWYALFALLVPMANIFCAHMLNAWFLNAYGERSTAVITHGEETNSMLNDQYIWDYDALVKTLDGKDVITGFSTMSASIYPIRNRILIPPIGDKFVVKFIPGYEKNFVILSDESLYGILQVIYEKKGQIEKARRMFEASPNNEEFKQAYRTAMQAFVDDPSNAPDSSGVQYYRAILSGMHQ